MMKTMQIFAWILLAVMLLTACGNAVNRTNNASYTPYSTREIAEAVIASQADIAPMNSIEPDDDFFIDYLTERYLIDIDEIEISEGIIFYAGGVIATEIAVLLLADDGDTAVVRELLIEYAARRMRVFATYAPVQAEILANSIVSVSGSHVALLISDDPQGAEAAFLAGFTATPSYLTDNNHTVPDTTAQTDEPDKIYSYPDKLSVHPGKFSDYNDERNSYREEPRYTYAVMYDPESILRAFNSGDTSGLSPENKRILDKCRYIISSEITDDMTELEMKYTILRWIIMWSVYDPEFLSNSPTAEPDPNNGNPYGLLFNHVAICWGFAYTFQLFMDLLDIECITVHGYDFSEGRHAWNLVYIDGIWSAVDVTLEVTLHNPLGVDPSHVPDSISHTHVNLSSDYLWNERGHRWDKEAVPEAFER